MEERVPKSEWGPGPWQDEPDRVDGEAINFATLALRAWSGAWCGYVGVPPGHPWYGVNYLDCLKKNCKARKRTLRDARRHAQMKRERAKSAADRRNWASTAQFYAADRFGGQLRSPCNHHNASPEALINVHGGLTYSAECHGEICHPHDANGVGVWWFGFDCNHCMDAAPGMEALMRSLKVRDLESPRLPGEIYRDLPYVQHEILALAKQLDMVAQLGHKLPPESEAVTSTIASLALAPLGASAAS